MPRTVVTSLRPVPESAPLAREVVRRALAGRLSEDALDTAELCVSELVTNAILHAGSELELQVTLRRPKVRLAVRDLSPELPTLERHTSTASTGRGLAMVVAVAEAWGVDQDNGRGKTVWCELLEHAGSVPDVDIQDVLDAWELTLPDAEPRAGRGSPVRGGEVLLAGYPVHLGLALQEHYDAVVRECQLLAAPRLPGAQGLPESLVELAVALAQRYTAELSDLARPDPRRIAAGARGATTVDLSYPMTPERVGQVRSWQRIFDDVDVYARHGDLLVPAISPDLAALRGWALAQFVQQTRGAPAQAWRGALA